MRPPRAQVNDATAFASVPENINWFEARCFDDDALVRCFVRRYNSRRNYEAKEKNGFQIVATFVLEVFMKLVLHECQLVNGCVQGA